MKQLLEKVYNKSQREFFEIIEDNLKSENKMFIVTANPETLMIGVNNPEFHDILKKGEVTITPDGIGVVKALSAIGRDVNERITGVDISKKLLEEGNKNNKSVYLYGAKPEVLDIFVAKLKKDYPNLIIAGARDGYNNDEDEVFKDILEKQPDIVLVALGIPRQEILINKYYHKLDKGICVGVGGSFDVLSGTKKRAPEVFIKLNLEWLYRIGKEPKRFGRFYKSNVKFIKIVNKLKQEGK